MVNRLFKNPKSQIDPIVEELRNLQTIVVDIEEPVSEQDEIEEIVHKLDIEEETVEEFITSEGDLKSRLIHFNESVILKEQPDTDPAKRLLRPAMLEALLEYKPLSKSEFLEFIPSYLRLGTDKNEGKYLNQIFDIMDKEYDLPS